MTTNLEKIKFQVVIPAAATNLVTNPSFETNSTGYSAVGGATLTRSATHQRRGAWALRITPVDSTTSGTYYGTVPVTSGTANVFSVDVLGVLGQDYRLELWNTTPTKQASLSFTGTGYWQRLEVTFTATATESWRLYVIRDAGETGTDYFYIDGLQFEAGSEATTYFDGDSEGFVIDRNDFGWNGTRHGSTSYRTAKTRAGGSLLSLGTMTSDDYRVLNTSGLGMGPFDQAYINIITGGMLYEGHTRKPRTISLKIDYNANTTIGGIMAKRAEIIDAIRPDVCDDQPMILRMQGFNSDFTTAAGEPVDVPCVLMPSMGNITDQPRLYQDTLTFLATDSILPGAYQEGVQLDFADSLANANYILMQDSDGIFANLGGGTNNNVYALATDASGNLYAGGVFTTAGGVTVNRIAKWDGSTWSALGSGMDGDVYALAADSSGNLYAAGFFTTAGGVTVNRIAKWDGSTWSALGSGMNGTVRALATDASGNLYAGGAFTTAGGVTVNYVAKWNGSSWSALGSGMNSTVRALATDASGNLYAGGDFTTAGGVTVNKIAKWNGSSWSALSSGMNSTVYTLAIDASGNLYAGGYFTTAGGVTVNYVAKWNGSSWSALGSGMNNYVYALAADSSGNLYAGGDFTTAGGLTITDRIAIWRDGVWHALSIDLPGDPTVYEILITENNQLIIGFSTTGTATVAGNVTATNGGGANCYPKVRIDGPGTLHKLSNNTTGAQITFAGLTLLTGEILTINFEPGNISAESTYRGNCLSYIAPGSDLADFYLRKGSNSISFLMTGTDGDTSAEMIWTPSYWSLDQTKHGA